MKKDGEVEKGNDCLSWNSLPHDTVSKEIQLLFK